MSPPLAGLKVIELARVLAGPWAGQTLADFGAKVICTMAPPPREQTTTGRSVRLSYGANLVIPYGLVALDHRAWASWTTELGLLAAEPLLLLSLARRDLGELRLRLRRSGNSASELADRAFERRPGRLPKASSFAA